MGVRKRLRPNFCMKSLKSVLNLIRMYLFLNLDLDLYKKKSVRKVNQNHRYAKKNYFNAEKS